MTWCSERRLVAVVVESQQGLQLPERYPIAPSFSMHVLGGGEMLFGGEEAALTVVGTGETLRGGVSGVPIAAWSPMPAPFSSAKLRAGLGLPATAKSAHAATATFPLHMLPVPLYDPVVSVMAP